MPVWCLLNFNLKVGASVTTGSPSETSMGTHMEPVEGDCYTDDEDGDHTEEQDNDDDGDDSDEDGDDSEKDDSGEDDDDNDEEDDHSDEDDNDTNE